jgi:hypothetical protein
MTIRRFALIAALALLPVIPYMLLGYTGQDLPFHVCSWLELRDGWLAGHPGPGWAGAANFGRGDPHLTLYPPLSYFLGALLTLVLPLKFAPAAFAWLALVLSGLAMHAASKPFVAERDRLLAAVLYMLGPYTITTSLVRYAAAELLVQAWLPLIALYFYEAVQVSRTEAPKPRTARRALLLLGLLLGLSWTTNIPASIVLLYSLGTAAVLCALLQRSLLPLLRIVLAEALAAALAAFHLLPVWAERDWVHPNTLLRIDPLQLLLFMPHYTFNDSPLLVVCWIFLCVQAALAAACLRKRVLPLSSDPAVPIWAAFAAASFLLQSPLAIPLWQHAPELRFVQFPLRFLSVIGVALPLMLLSRGTRRALRRPACILTGVLSVTPFLMYLSEQAVAANRSPPLPELLASWRRKGAPEYLPAGTLMPAGPSGFPALSSVAPSNALAADPLCRTEMERERADQRVFRTLSEVPCRVRLAVFFYPYWRASDERHRGLSISREPTGFLLIDVPAGAHTVSLDFRAASPTRTASRLVSLMAVLLSAAWLWADRRRMSRPPRTEVTGPGADRLP